MSGVSDAQQGEGEPFTPIAGRPPTTEQALRLTASLWRFWDIRGHLEEGLGCLTLAVALYRRSESPEPPVGLAPLYAGVLNALGNICNARAEYTTARANLREALDIYRTSGHLLRVAMVLSNLGTLADREEEYSAARAFYLEALATFRSLAYPPGIAGTLNNLGLVAYNEGDYAAAGKSYEEALGVFQNLGDQRGIGFVLNNLGHVAFRRGDFAKARALLKSALRIGREEQDKRRMVESWEALSHIAQCDGASETAAKLLGAAAALRESYGAPLPLVERVECDHTASAARASLGRVRFQAAVAEGRAMPLDAAIEFALKEPETEKGTGTAESEPVPFSG